MTRYRYFLLSSVLQFPYSVNVQQYRFFFAPTLPPYIENSAAAHAGLHLSAHTRTPESQCMSVSFVSVLQRPVPQPTIPQQLLHTVKCFIIIYKSQMCQQLKFLVHFTFTEFTSRGVLASQG